MVWQLEATQQVENPVKKILCKYIIINIYNEPSQNI